MLTKNEIYVINYLNHPTYNVKFISEWIDRRDNVMINAPAALQCMGVSGFMDAVRALEIKMILEGKLDA